MKQSVIVIGLGRFGSSAARELMTLGHEVLAVDDSEQHVNDIAPDVTHAQQLDASDEQALRDVGAGEFEHAIVAISSNIEASIFATMALKDLGVRNVLAKAANQLTAGSSSESVQPASSIPSARWAPALRTPSHPGCHRLPRGRTRLRRGQGPTSRSFVGKTLRELDVPGRLSLTAVALRRGKQVTVNPSRDERIEATDELILIGLDEKLELLER